MFRFGYPKPVSLILENTPEEARSKGKAIRFRAFVTGSGRICIEKLIAAINMKETFMTCGLQTNGNHFAFRSIRAQIISDLSG